MMGLGVSLSSNKVLLELSYKGGRDWMPLKVGFTSKSLYHVIYIVIDLLCRVSICLSLNITIFIYDGLRKKTIIAKWYAKEG
jgi:hypothetical protein